MQIQHIALSELTPYDKNPRLNDAAVPKVAESIQRFGFKVPLVIDSQKVIVAGHTRFKAAQSLGLDAVPCIVADDLTPEQIRAFRLADNKVAEFSEWDFTTLHEELEALQDLDMSEFGFANIDLHDDDLSEFFEEPEQPKESKVKTTTCPHCGEVFEL